jgi:uncharacterized protein YbjT (DUF2867 family)
MILVTAATGHIGPYLVQNLVARGEAVRAMTRSEAKARAISALEGADIAVADFRDPDALDAALDGVTRVYWTTESHPEQLEHHAIFIDALKRSKVELVVKNSVIAAEFAPTCSFCRWNREGEILLMGSGLPWTLVRPHQFIDNYRRNAPEIAQGRMYGARGDGRAAMIDVRDVAAAAAAIVAGEDQAWKTHYLSGPEAFTADEAAAAFTDILGWEVQAVDLGSEGYWKILRAKGLDRWFATALIGIEELWRDGYGDVVSSTVEDLTGRPARTLRDWITENADHFRAARG